jgi:hypothetical protein
MTKLVYGEQTDDTTGETTDDVVSEVRRRLSAHERAWVRHLRAGNEAAACFEAESAEILAEWLRRHDLEPVAGPLTSSADWPVPNARRPGKVRTRSAAAR